MRDKNDKLTMISIILIAIFTFNLGGITAIILRLILRKNDSEAIRKCWFVPGAVAGVLPLIVNGARYIANLEYFSYFLTVIGSALLSAAFYLIFGYWFIKYLKLNKNTSEAK